MSEEINVQENPDGKQMDVEAMLEDAAQNAEVQSEEEQKEQEIKIGERWHESHTDRRAISSILRKYREGNIKLPLAQRLYVWNEKQRKSLLRSAKKGYGCGCLSLGTHEGDSDEISYLVDGQQRLISMMLLSNDESLSKEERKIILDYQMPIVTVYQLNWDEMSEWFLAINSGVPVASVVKERSKLPAKLNNTILSVSGSDFFRSISEKANATFRKSHHHEIIAENILLASAGIKIASIKAKDVCKRLQEHETDIYDYAKTAITTVERLNNIYKDMTDDIIMRSMNATFLAVLVYVMHDHPDINDGNYIDLINYVFANKHAVKAYTETTGRYSASEESCKKRYNAILNLLNNIPEQKTDFNEQAYRDFCNGFNGKVMNTNDNGYPVAFEDIEEEDRKRLYIARDVNRNKKEYENIIMDIYDHISQNDDKESA